MGRRVIQELLLTHKKRLVRISAIAELINPIRCDFLPRDFLLPGVEKKIDDLRRFNFATICNQISEKIVLKNHNAGNCPWKTLRINFL